MKMSFFKKATSALFALAIIFSTALTAAAQTTNNANGLNLPTGTTSATPAQLAELNNTQPEAYIKTLVLDNTDYQSGSTVKGSFSLWNDKNISISNLSYQAALVGDLMPNGLYRATFDSQILGSLFLDKNETKTINFGYRLPLSSRAYTLGKQLAIEIRTFSGSGLPLRMGGCQNKYY